MCRGSSPSPSPRPRSTPPVDVVAQRLAALVEEHDPDVILPAPAPRAGISPAPSPR